MTHEPDRVAAIGSEKGAAADAIKKPWWHVAMLNPALPVALIPVIVGAIGYLAGSIPQIMQWKAARDLNVPTSGLARALEANKAWEDNRACLRETEIEQISLRSPGTYTISLQSCPSGDILLALTPLHDPTNLTYEWVITRKLFRQQTSFSFTTMALAEVAPPPNAAPIRVIDIRSQGRNVVRRLQLSNNSCIDEIVETATGRRVSSQSAPCTRF
jgi:hypothetical protein